MKLVSRFVTDEPGATAIECGLIAARISMFRGTVPTFGASLKAK